MSFVKYCAFLILLLTCSCADGIISECPEETPAGLAATFSSIEKNVIAKNCATVGCHTGSTPEKGLNLASGHAYNSIVNKTTQNGSSVLVIPGNADESYLFQLISTDIESVRMPKNAGRLPQATIDTIKAWIDAGALNN